MAKTSYFLVIFDMLRLKMFFRIKKNKIHVQNIAYKYQRVPLKKEEI